MPLTNPYKPIIAKVTRVADETPSIKTFTLVPEEKIEFKTGQFVQFTVPEVGEAPFTPSSSPFVKEEMDITIMKAGRVTEAIHSLKEEDVVGIRGPLGKGYPLEEFYEKEILILGGGVGMAPLRSLLLTFIAQKTKFKRIVLLYGARTPEDIVYKDQFAAWEQEGVEIHRSVDKGDDTWKERVGVVTVLFDEVKLDNEIAIVCGPPIMMKFGTFKLLEIGYKPENIYLSMEKNMSCGIGKCGHCALGPYFVCKDGPVFKYSEIKNIEDIWD